MKLNPEIKLLKKEVHFLRMNYYQLFLINFIKDLSPRYQKLLSMRFGFEDGITHTLEDVAKEFGVTRERIRQMEAKAIEKIKRENSY